MIQQELYASKKVALYRFNELKKDYPYVALIKSVRGYWLETEPAEILRSEKIIKKFEEAV